MSTTWREVIWFRIIVALSVLVFTFWGAKHLDDKDTADARKKSAVDWYNYWKQQNSICETNPSNSDCESTTFENALKYMGEDASAFQKAKAQADHEWYLAWFIPIALLAVFYALRWAFTGRFRPFWPLRL